MATNAPSKIKRLEDLGLYMDRLRKNKKKIVHCHGVFDLLHLGHIRHLNAAKKFGDILVVTLTADRYVKRGPGRPVFNHDLRAETLANLAITDYVAVVDGPTAVDAIKAIRPNFYVKGSDYVNKEQDLTKKIYDEEGLVKANGGKLVFTDDLTFSSSQLINLHLDSYPAATVKYLKKLSEKYSIDYISQAMKRMSQLKILVIGDTIIDQYHYCTAMGKSSKESIVAHRYMSEEDFAGGSLATANHVAQVSPRVGLATVLGEKNSFQPFIRKHLDKRIKPKFFHCPNSVTTIKRRYVNQEANRKMFEICYLDDFTLEERIERQIISYLRSNLSKFDLVVVSDFGHGMITKEVVNLLCAKSKCLAVNVQTNSANLGFNLVTKFPRADFVCIDQMELQLATGERFGSMPTLVKRIQRELRAKQVIATRGASGSISYNKKDGIHEAPTYSRQSLDTMGAGDAFYSFAAPCFAAGVPQDLLSFIGNAVGSLKVQIVGNREPVKTVDLMKFMSRLLKM